MIRDGTKIIHVGALGVTEGNFAVKSAPSSLFTVGG